MAPTDFPLSRTVLSKLPAQPEAHKAHKQMMERMLEHTVREFERYTYVQNGTINPAQWRPVSRQQASMNGQNDEHVTVYTERDCGETSTSLAYALQGAQPMTSVISNTHSSALAALTPAAVLVAGRAPGKLESVMYALAGPHSQENIALFASFMYDDIADCGLLHTLEPSSIEDETTCRFLGYKYVVKRSAASNVKLVRHRDVVYIQSTGYTHTSHGERLGFHMEHSVDVAGFPDLSDRNSVRALQSVRYLFRQKSERVLEVFALGNLELSTTLTIGGVGAAGPNGSVGGDLFSVSRLLQCAETRRLSLMVRKHRESIELLQSSKRSGKSECYLCRRTKRFFGGALLSECAICGQFVCSKCRNDKKVFVFGSVSDGQLGKFQRAQTCKTCVLAASVGYAPPPMHMCISQQVKQNQGSKGRAASGSGSERDIMDGRRSTGVSSSRSSSVGGRSESSASAISAVSAATSSGSEFHSYRQGLVYSFPEVNEGEEWKEAEKSPKPQAEQFETGFRSVREPQVNRKLLSTRMLGKLKEQKAAPPSSFEKQEADTTQDSQFDGKLFQPRQSISTAKSRARGQTTSSTSSASSVDSSSDHRQRSRAVGATTTKPYDQEHQCKYPAENVQEALAERSLRDLDTQQNQVQEEQEGKRRHHRHHRHHRTKHVAERAMTPRGNCQPSRHEKALIAYRASHQLPVQGAQDHLTSRYKSSADSDSVSVRRASAASRRVSHIAPPAVQQQFPQFPHLSRGIRRAETMPRSSYDSDESMARRATLMAQMVELSEKAESTYNTTQRNGAFLSQQARVHTNSRQRVQRVQRVQPQA